MSVLFASPSPITSSSSCIMSLPKTFQYFQNYPYSFFLHPPHHSSSPTRSVSVVAYVCTPPHRIDRSSLVISEASESSQDELWATAWLRVRSFNVFQPSTFGIQDHRRYLAEREFEALKERISGKRLGFRKVSCINASLPLSQLKSLSDDLCAECKYTDGGEDRVVVGTLDLSQCIRLPDEIAGMKPEGIGADFARAYLSNVCVANELRRNGLGVELVAKSKIIAQQWGITDLYVHVAVDNEPAKNLYTKSGFVYESDEPAWQARFLDRPRRLLLWLGLPHTQDSIDKQ